MSEAFSISPVAMARTPFKQKFAIPRQAGLVDIPAVIELLPPFNQALAVEGLEDVSHIWLTFLFHRHLEQEANLQVRPPRLGGNQKIGVFATRSSFRPNGLGQSLVKLECIEVTQNGVFLHVTGLDLLDGTPIVDIKPYLPYADIKTDAVNGIASDKPEMRLDVQWSSQALQQLQAIKDPDPQQFKLWIDQLIAFDPRPAYKHNEAGGHYAMQLFAWDIHWQMQTAQLAIVNHIEPLGERETL